MVHVELGDMGSGCRDENCGLTSGFPEGCLNQECQGDEAVFGLIELVSVTAIYIPLMLFGLLGNILTILVVWLRPHMRSSTYLYLSSMAVSDLLILLLLPLDLYKLWRPTPWPLGDLACKLTMFLSECCTFCTILHITFLSLERYLAVCWPITAKTLVTRRRTRALIGCLWLCAAVSAAPVLVMVGVEDVGGEELGLSRWREDVGMTSEEGKGLMTGGGEKGNGHMASTNGGFEGVKWGEKEKMGWKERNEEFKWLGEEGEIKVGIEDRNERKERDEGKHDEGGGEDKGEGEMEVEGEQQNKMKEDEGGGIEGGADRSECRCTDYAVTSGLLSAMMVLSNLYFLVPLGILALVYSLIGRTLWLRPQSSRRDQSHRHTVKMLGMIVLAFVLCWLPFHVGRTIFSFSMGIGSDRQEAHTDTELHLDINALPDVSLDRNTNMQAVTGPISHSDTDTHFKTGKMAAHSHLERGDIFCDVCAKTRVKIKTDEDTQLGRFTGNTSFHIDTNTYRANVHTVTNMTLICINSQTNTPDHTHTYTVTPSGFYNHSMHNGSETHTHTYEHLHFLYYLSQYFNLVSSVLFCLSAAINPLLYNLMSAKYRHAVRSLVRTHSHTQSYRLHTLTVRHSTTTL